MKIQCNVCEAAEAVVLCCADEAALCWACDEKVHAANKLAGKHQRVPLSVSSSSIPKCDICQVWSFYFPHNFLFNLRSDFKPPNKVWIFLGLERAIAQFLSSDRKNLFVPVFVCKSLKYACDFYRKLLDSSSVCKIELYYVGNVMLQYTLWILMFQLTRDFFWLESKLVLNL